MDYNTTILSIPIMNMILASITIMNVTITTVTKNRKFHFQPDSTVATLSAIVVAGTKTKMRMRTKIRVRVTTDSKSLPENQKHAPPLNPKP